MKIYNSTLFLICCVCVFLFFVIACSKEEDNVKKEVQFSRLDFDYNEHDLEEVFDNDLAKLGRILFYDKELSINSTVSCGSCHKQEFAFGDQVAKSEGFLGGLTKRNTPNLLNTKFNRLFFWDGRTFSFLDAVTQPIFNHEEMGMTPETLIDRLSKLDYYEPLFTGAFGNNRITGLRIQTALTEFVGSILSLDAEIDHFRNGTHSLSDSALKGLSLFESKNCNNCHRVVSPDNPDQPYLGISTTATTSSRLMVDIGLALEDSLSTMLPPFPPFLSFTNETSSNQFIRIPSLRNITSTAPYMHDGRFQTLLEVIDHYNENVLDRSTIDERLLNTEGQAQKLDLTEEEKQHLIDFLETLSDPTIEALEKFSDPFL